MFKPGPGSAILITALSVVLDCLSTLAVVGVLRTSHHVSLSASGALVLAHERSDSHERTGRAALGHDHVHALGDGLMIAWSDDQGTQHDDHGHTITARVGDRIVYRGFASGERGRADRLAPEVLLPSPEEQGREQRSRCSPLGPPSIHRRSIVLRI